MKNRQRIIYTLLITSITALSLNAMDNFTPPMRELATKKMEGFRAKDFFVDDLIYNEDLLKIFSKETVESCFWANIFNAVFEARNVIIPNLKKELTLLETKKPSIAPMFDLYKIYWQNLSEMRQPIIETIGKVSTNDTTALMTLLTIMEKYFKEQSCTEVMQQTEWFTETDNLTLPDNPFDHILQPNAMDKVPPTILTMANTEWEKNQKLPLRETNKRLYEMDVFQKAFPEQALRPLMIDAFFEVKNTIIPELKKQIQEKRNAIKQELALLGVQEMKKQHELCKPVFESMKKPENVTQTVNLMLKYFYAMKAQQK